MRPTQHRYTVNDREYYSLKLIAEMKQIAESTARAWFRSYAIKVGSKYFVLADAVENFVPNLIQQAEREKKEKTVRRKKADTTKNTEHDKSVKNCQEKHRVM